MSFMTMKIYQKGRLATCDCSKCGTTHYWHEWTSDGGAEDLKTAHCNECRRPLDPETYWESPKRNYYAGRYSAPGYMDCTDWHYDTNKRRLERELREMYGN
jgi:hypothetical protein